MIELAQIGGFLIGAIAILLFLISRLKWHPSIALLAISMVSGLFIGLDWLSSIQLIWEGFYNVVLGIGLVILLGSVLGSLMEVSGSLSAITGLTLRIFGKKRPLTAVSVLGFFVGIPVFCDSGFIILSKVAKQIAKKNALKTGSTSIALAGGLYTTHTLIPPTPGPIAAAANLQISSQLGFVMIIGLLVSIPVVLMLVFISAKLFNNAAISTDIDINQEYNRNYRLLLPVVLAIALISLGSVSSVIDLSIDSETVVNTISHPAIALSIACIVAFLQSTNYKSSTFTTIKGIEQSVPIILITGAGGAFGLILKQSELSTILRSTFDQQTTTIGVVVTAYIISLILKSAQGSSTAALVITSSIMFPIIEPMQLSLWHTALIVSVIGSGAMAVSHANDSYFWVVTKFSDLSIEQGYKKYSVMTVVLSLTGLLMSLFLFAIG